MAVVMQYAVPLATIIVLSSLSVYIVRMGFGGPFARKKFGDSVETVFSSCNPSGRPVSNPLV